MRNAHSQGNNCTFIVHFPSIYPLASVYNFTINAPRCGEFLLFLHFKILIFFILSLSLSVIWLPLFISLPPLPLPSDPLAVHFSLVCDNEFSSVASFSITGLPEISWGCPTSSGSVFFFIDWFFTLSFLLSPLFLSPPACLSVSSSQTAFQG